MTADGYVIDDGRCLRCRQTRRQLREHRVLLALLGVSSVVFVGLAIVRGDSVVLISLVLWALALW